MFGHFVKNTYFSAPKSESINNLNHIDMKIYQTNEIKNIALLGSAGSGKTTLAESMLFESGVIKRRGSVEAKTTRSLIS